MSQQTFHTIDTCRLEVAVKPTTPHNLVANPSGALGAWGWVTPGTSYMRKAAGANVLEHVSAVASQTVFYTEPMPITAGHFAAAAFSIPSPTAPAGFSWGIEFLTSTYASNGFGPFIAVSTFGTHSRPAASAPAGTAFFRLHFVQPGAGTVRLTNVRAVTAPTAAALAGTTIRNLIPNPSFEVDTATWTVPTGGATTHERSTTYAVTGAASLYMWRNVGPNPGVVVVETTVAVEGGRDYTAQARFRETVSGGFGRIHLYWRDSVGNPIGTEPYAAGPTTGNTAFAAPLYLTATAPPSAVSCIVRVSHSVPGPGNAAGVYVDAIAFTPTSSAVAYFDGSTAASGTLTYAWEGTAHASASKLTDTDLTTLAETEWRNILGPTHRLSTVRESLNVGTLEAELLDAALDPATSATLRPGGDVRVLALVSSVWEPIFVGQIDRLLVTYDDKRRPIRPPRVSMTALDRTVRLTSASRLQGVGTVAGLPHVLEGVGLPWNVDGVVDQLLAAPTVVSVNDRASALDQVALTRDSTASHAWVDRKGVLVATTGTAASSRTLTEPRYSDLEVAFSSEECMNAIEIECLTIVDGRTEPVIYGPYEDPVSIAQWGRRARKFTVHGLTSAQVATLASTILTRNANPGVTVQSVALPMRNGADLADAVRDLGEIVTVSNTARGIAPVLRTTRVAHTIQSSPQKWMVRLGFTRSTSVASPTITPPVDPKAVGTFPDGLYHLATLASDWTFGDGYPLAETPARTTTGKRIRLTVAGAFNPPGAGTGLLVEWQGRLNGGAWTPLTPACFMVAGQAYQEGFTFTTIDTPPPGETQYRVRVAAHYANGQVLRARTQFTAEQIA